VLCKAESAAKEAELLHDQCYKVNQSGPKEEAPRNSDPWGLLQTYGVQIHQGT